jgi:hypothetical protein
MFGKESKMQVSRLGFWTRSVVVGIFILSVAMSARVQAQRIRVSALENRRFEDVLDTNGRRAPGLDLRGNNSLHSAPQVDLNKIDRRPLINLLKEAVSEATLLYKSLRSDATRSPELQGSLQHVLRLRDAARYDVEDLEDGKSLQRLFPSIQKLNTDWRLLSHQLGQSARISRKSLEIVDRIDRIEREMEKMFKLKTELDRRALVNEFARLESMLENLMQDLDYDLGATNRVSEIVYETRKLAQQARQIEDMVLDGDNYERIVSQYNRFSTQWNTLFRQLRPIDSRYIRRGIRNIVDSDARINDLLWLEQSTNREHLHQLSNSLIKSVDEFFSRTPLKLVVHLKNVDSILETAADFYGTVEHFKQSVDNNANDAELMDNYGYVEEYGTRFIQSFAKLRSSAGRVVLREIEDGIASLRAELNISGTAGAIDTQKLVMTAASLENLADHLQFDVNNWLNRDRQSFRTEALQAMDNFVQRSRRMHRLMQTRPTLKQLRQESTDLNTSWTSLYNYLSRCRTNDRVHMIDVARDINDALYELEAPLQL